MYTSGNGARETAARITIVFSDGNSNINPERTVPDAIDVKINTGVHMMVVSVGTLLNRLELEGMASSPTGANVFAVESINNLNSIIDVVISATFDGKFALILLKILKLQIDLWVFSNYFLADHDYFTNSPPAGLLLCSHVSLCLNLNVKRAMAVHIPSLGNQLFPRHDWYVL